jgi:hypothetical protein
MNSRDDLNLALRRFRLAARDLFNSSFRVERPYDSDIAWLRRDSFLVVESALFKALVTEAMKLPDVSYGHVQSEIAVLAREKLSPVEVMIGKDGDSGYWERPIDLPPSAELRFMKFFDWGQLEVRDNRYVRVKITAWPGRAELTGRDALVEALHVRFERAADSTPQ